MALVQDLVNLDPPIIKGYHHTEANKSDKLPTPISTVFSPGNGEKLVEMDLDNKHFDNMENGRKTVEIRKNSKTWEDVVKGTIILVKPKKYEGQRRKEFKVKVL